MARNPKIDLEITGTFFDGRKKVNIEKAKILVNALMENITNDDRLVVVYIKQGTKKTLVLEN